MSLIVAGHARAEGGRQDWVWKDTACGSLGGKESVVCSSSSSSNDKKTQEIWRTKKNREARKRCAYGAKETKTEDILVQSRARDRTTDESRACGAVHLARAWEGSGRASSLKASLKVLYSIRKWGRTATVKVYIVGEDEGVCLPSRRAGFRGPGFRACVACTESLATVCA